LNIFTQNHFPKKLIACLIFILFQSCAPGHIRPPSPPFTSQEIALILSEAREQERRVHTFFSSGRLTLKTRDSESEANILIAGTRNFLRIKIETTHSWGRPLVHVFINEAELHILSFPEKRIYHGHLENSSGLDFFPGVSDPDQVWTIVRGYPVLPEHKRAVSVKGNQISLLNSKAERAMEVSFYHETRLPHRVLYPEQGIEMLFSDFEIMNGTYYARKIILNDLKGGITLTLKIKNMTFNEEIPEQIFNLEAPDDFKTYSFFN